MELCSSLFPKTKFTNIQNTISSYQKIYGFINLETGLELVSSPLKYEGNFSKQSTWLFLESDKVTSPNQEEREKLLIQEEL